MADLRYITYTSTATQAMGDAQLQRLLVDARDFNAGVGVTGVLLFNGLAFFQYFEGPPDGCAKAYARIRASTQHHSIFELGNAALPARQFADWTMGYSDRATDSEWQALSGSEHWATPGSLQQPGAAPCEGVVLLSAFWQASAGAA